MLKTKDGKIDMWLVSVLIITTVQCSTGPAIWIEISRVISADVLQIKNIGMEIFSIIFSSLWAKYSDKLYKHYDKFLCIEFISVIVLLCII